MQDQLEDLQIRWAHQELAIEALNETVARQDQQIVELRQIMIFKAAGKDVDLPEWERLRLLDEAGIESN